VIVDVEARRCDGGQVARAGQDLEDAAAEGAEEVVVVVSPGGLVAVGLAREGDGVEPVLGDEGGDGSVDGGEAHGGHVGGGEGEGLGRAEGAIGTAEGGLDRLALAGVADHWMRIGSPGRELRKEVAEWRSAGRPTRVVAGFGVVCRLIGARRGGAQGALPAC